ncbi:MAG TPA: GNAT family N-acetyltransferase [Propionicimonas sp.]|nr:GNAT family N-acetyltransferase [Propionicimonas sp.]HQA78505.1 GNAT family N-acetyltransferase [Propionicimonas sp.]HQD97751.1 GNAT family N-acetyltransferase [Propionicimonas sp.]
MFAPYSPGRGEQPIQVAVVDLATEQIARCVEIVLQREGGHSDAWRSRLEKAPTAPDQVTLVALVETQVVGYGSARRLTPRTLKPDAAVPDGWYLTGVIVDRPSRRRGVASRLTEARLRWLSGRTGRVWYFVSDRIRPPSIRTPGLGSDWWPGISGFPASA